MRARAAVLLAVLAAAGVAGCGGGGDPVQPTTAATAGTTAPDAAALPSTEAPGVTAGILRRAPTASAFVDLVYRSDDPGAAAAVARLEAAGYAGGVLRDQLGTDPDTGLSLLRSYAIRLRDDAAAAQEAGDAAREVRDANPAAEEIDTGIPGGHGLAMDASQGAFTGRVVFVTFPAGDAVYGIQAAARAPSVMPQDEVVAAAQALAERAGAGA